MLRPFYLKRFSKRREPFGMSHGEFSPLKFDRFESCSNAVPIAQLHAMVDSKRNFPIGGFNSSRKYVTRNKEMQMLKNFAFLFVIAKGTWSISNLSILKLQKIRETVGLKMFIRPYWRSRLKCFCRSLIAKKLLESKLTCIFVDHGLLRKMKAIKFMDSLRR